MITGTAVSHVVKNRGHNVGTLALWEVSNGQITRWHESLGERPTTEELAVAATQLKQLATLRAGLLTAWEQTFTAGERAFLKPVFTEALAAFDHGDLAGCKELVATAPSVSPDLDAKQAFIVGLFPK